MPPPSAPDGPQPRGGAAPYRRAKETARAVLIADATADWTIRIGGVSVIVAVFGIMVFLAEVVLPLFAGGRLEGQTATALVPAEGRVVMAAIDEYQTMAATIDDHGRVVAFHARTGTPVTAPTLDFQGLTATAFGRTLTGTDLAFGFEDGTIRLATLRFHADLLEADAVSADLRAVGDAADRTDGTAIYTPIATGQMRRVSVTAEIGEPQQVAAVGRAIRAIDYRLGGPAERPTRVFITLDANGIGRITRAETRKNMMTGRERVTLTTAELPGLAPDIDVVATLVNDKGDVAYFAERSGIVRRYDVRDFANPVLAETVDLAPGPASLTAMVYLIGEQSMAVGRDDGSVDIYFRIPRDGATTTDGYALTATKRLQPHDAAVVAIAPAQRGKVFATADAAGEIRLRHSTSEQLLLTLPTSGDGVLAALTVAPRDDAVIAVRDGQVATWTFAAPHPETTLQTIFAPTWYEGYPQPTQTWQSSAGSDAFEPKFSLVPLIFGTLKATFYSLLFAVPIALGAAIFTSEFTTPTVRAVIKPTMELMAALPSVVLGFIAAIILAPIIETWIAAVIIAFGAIPIGLVLGGCLWQMLPRRVQSLGQGLPRLALMLAALIASLGLCLAAAVPLERLFFAGDFKAWVAGTAGSATAFQALILWPLAFGALWLAAGRLFAGPIEAAMRGPARAAGRAYLGRWLATAAIAGLIAWAMAVAMAGLGFDARGGVIDGFVQRNTLIVGFAMGFAVIPIIYTVSEDALSAVPDSLRAASLALGATPWQTTIKVVVPAAMSGIFAAIMVGMGRAVGETMIVVMAAGNTPIIDWNVFAGLRALSANIAVELPEAVRDSTLYRMLFLAALTLFVMTFVINTVAEAVRLRFRKQTTAL
jgi:phosphate transport system permease protein